MQAAMTQAEWLAWRHEGLGSSDASSIMLASKWKTWEQLLAEKSGSVIVTEPNWAMERGLRLEPKARAQYELINDRDMPAQLAVHPEHSFVRASLDGLNRDMRRALEIKCPGVPDHATAKAGDVPKKYIWQIVHQFLVCDNEIDVIDYFSYWEDKQGRNQDTAFVPVKKDSQMKKLMAQLLAAETDFWKQVLENRKRRPAA